MDAKEILVECHKLLEERQEQYGKIGPVMRDTRRMLFTMGIETTDSEICWQYAINKLVRNKKKKNLDNVMDAINYIALSVELEAEQYDN